ncbi:MAG: DUF1080 domain-containing protein [Akkermansiaceae bacterium]
MKSMIPRALLTLAITACFLAPASGEEKEEKKKPEEKWVSLFNGKDLTGWSPKIRGHKLGENYKNTFRVVDGLLTVSYDQYDTWNDKFGHLFYEKSYSKYRIRVEYRFIGKQIKGGPAWALRNSGIMCHGQSAKSMGLDQKFPNSIEVQLLGGGASGKRTTANLCTPGTQVFYKDPRKSEADFKLDKRHCITSQSETFRGEQWVTCEVEVQGSDYYKHYINGKLVMEYQKPQSDDGTLLEKGTISLQSESHPVQFRKVELLVIEK